MNQELKNDIIAIWNESEELLTSFSELNDEELIEVKNSILQRIMDINYLSGKYVTENDIKAI